MRYDIEALHTFQDVLERVKWDRIYGQHGICSHIKWCSIEQHIELQDWMHHKYMPDKHMGEYWWPKIREYHSDKELEQAKQDRIQFLERIIEDLMCGE